MSTSTSPLSRKVPAKSLGTALLLFILIKPSLLEQDELLNEGFKAASAAIFLGLLLAFSRNKMRVSGPLMAFAVFRAFLLIPTLASGGDVANWGYASVVQLSIFMLIELCTSRGREDALGLLRCVANLLLAYLAVNAFMVFARAGVTRLWSNGYVETWYLLGIRTRITESIFVAAAVSMTHDAMVGKKVSLRTFFIWLVGLYQVVALNVSTAEVGIFLAVVAFLVYRLFPRAVRMLSMRNLTYGGLALSFGVVCLRLQVSFAFAIQSLLGKSPTLTGRTDLWDVAIPIVSASPVIGYGINYSFGAFIPLSGTDWQAHDQYLQLMYDGGFLGVGLFIIFLLVCAKPFDSFQGRFLKRPLLAVYFAFCCMMVTEIYTYNMAVFYLLPFIASRFDAFRAPGLPDHVSLTTGIPGE
jgi:O-antigen ligase